MTTAETIRNVREGNPHLGKTRLVVEHTAAGR
jgi:hypothetical protein